ncbi:MAG: hypothetical protein ABR592_06050 [Nitriliruptorales bacterium]
MGARIAAASFFDKLAGGRSEPSDARPSVRSDVLLAALALAVLVPLTWGTLRAVFASPGEVAFGGDYAVLEIYTLHAKRLSQLLGPYSRLHWNHPGPFYFYLLLPFYLAFGESTRGLLIGAFTISLVSMAGAVWVARHAFSTSHAMLLVAFIALTLRFLGFQTLSDPWNSLVTVLPSLLFLMLCWLFSSGRGWGLLGMTVLGSFLVQTHAGHASLVAAAGVAAFVLGCVALRRRGHLWRGLLLPLAVSATCAFLLWLPPLWQEATRSEGNLTLVMRFLGSESRGEAGWEGMSAAIDEPLASVPLGGLAVLGHARTTCAVSRGLDCVDASLTWSLPTHALLLAAGLFVAARRGRRDTLYLGIITAAGLIGAAWAMRSIQAQETPYLPLWPAALGIATYVTACHALLPGPRSRHAPTDSRANVFAAPAASGALLDQSHPPASRSLTGPILPRRGPAQSGRDLWRVKIAPAPPLLRFSVLAVAVLLIGVLAFSNVRHALAIAPYEALSEPDWVGFDEGRAADALTAQIDGFLSTRPGPHEPVVRLVQHGVWPVVAAVVLRMYHEGHPLAVEPNWLFMFGEQFVQTGEETEELLFGAGHFHRCASGRPDLTSVATFVAGTREVYVYHRVPPLEAHPRCPRNLAGVVPDD